MDPCAWIATVLADLHSWFATKFDWEDFRAWLAVGGTWAIAALALWGEKIRAALFKPKLRLELSTSGERTRFVDGPEEERYPVHHYHLRVTNQRRVIAHDVQVLVTRLDLLGPDNRPQPYYTSAHLPLAWRLQEIYGNSRTIGRATKADASLLYVRQEFLRITLILTPNNFPDTMAGITGGAHFWLTLVARGLESESRPLRLKIDWDGRWEEGESEMRRHLTIVKSRR